jgi:hypothetical protein
MPIYRSRLGIPVIERRIDGNGCSKKIWRLFSGKAVVFPLLAVQQGAKRAHVVDTADMPTGSGLL